VISYEDIRNGIADAVMQAFDALPITDDNRGHITTPAVFVHLTDAGHVLFDLHQVHRSMDFDVVYLAEPETPPAQVLADGQKLAAYFQPCLDFAGRHITVGEVDLERVDEDMHASFTLDFYDDLENTQTYDYMQTIDFHMTLKKE
jgi:hypothetical protein